MLKLDELNNGDEIVYNGGDYHTCIEKGKTYKVRQEGKIDFSVRCVIGRHDLTQTGLSHFSRFIQQRGGWIGVDLDSTLAVYDGWKGPYHIGEPIPAMVARVKAWIAQGRDVRIFTARVTDRPTNEDGTPHDLSMVRDRIEKWCHEHIGQILSITNVKDWHMMELWDDRCVQVRPNTGISLADELEAIRNAEAKPKYPE